MTAAPERAAPPRDERRARRAAARAFRPRRALPALLAGGVLLAASGAAAADLVSALLGTAPLPLPRGLVQAAAGARWGDLPVRAACAGALLIGLALLGAALLPGRGPWSALRTGDPDLVAAVSRGAVRRSLAAAASRVDGVHRVRVSVRGRRVRVRARVRRHRGAEAEQEVRAAVRSRLEGMDPLRPMRVRTRLRRDRS
ncbi:alkaline shock response membrane anchor protein AmaP [Nocardiopsis sp. CNT-189]